MQLEKEKKNYKYHVTFNYFDYVCVRFISKQHSFFTRVTKYIVYSKLIFILKKKKKINFF